MCWKVANTRGKSSQVRGIESALVKAGLPEKAAVSTGERREAVSLQIDVRREEMNVRSQS